jgi:hypothetical protein
MIFDFVLFGALVLAALIDRVVPALSGGALLVVTGVWTYLSAIDLSDWLRQKKVRSHESLLTSLAIAVLGVVYYTTYWQAQQFTRASENLVLLVLSIVLMMTALMAAIAVISMVAEWRCNGAEWGLLTAWSAATVGACYWLWTIKDLTQIALWVAALSAVALIAVTCLFDPKRARGVVGLLATVAGAAALGLAASYIVLLAMPQQKPFLMFILFAAAFIIGRALMSHRIETALAVPPPSETPETAPPVGEEKPAAILEEAASQIPTPELVAAKPIAPAPASKPFALPLRGWILPRFAAVLMLAPVLFYLVEVFSVEKR